MQDVQIGHFINQGLELFISHVGDFMDFVSGAHIPDGVEGDRHDPLLFILVLIGDDEGDDGIVIVRIQFQGNHEQVIDFLPEFFVLQQVFQVAFIQWIRRRIAVREELVLVLAADTFDEVLAVILDQSREVIGLGQDSADDILVADFKTQVAERF